MTHADMPFHNFWPRDKAVLACAPAILFLGLRHKEIMFARDYGHFTNKFCSIYTFGDVIRTLPRRIFISMQRSEAGKLILLDATPGATSPSEPAEVRCAVIPPVPFALPEGYQLGSMVVHLYCNSQHATRPLQLCLPHCMVWWGGACQRWSVLCYGSSHTQGGGECVLL